MRRTPVTVAVVFAGLVLACGGSADRGPDVDSATATVATGGSPSSEPHESPRQTEAIAEEGRIAFVSRRDNNGGEIYTMNPDGSGVTRLTENSNVDMEPAWSPDAQRIAFASYRDGNFDIYTMNWDGTSLTRLTNSPHNDYEPEWSPDGTRIAFSTDRWGDHEIYVIGADGSGEQRLTSNQSEDRSPTWAPTGKHIAFTRDLSYYVMKDDGSDQIPLTRGLWVAWSPDGSRIVFDDGELFTSNLDGSGLKQLTTRDPNQGGFVSHYYPAWSPDGQAIAFLSISLGSTATSGGTIDVVSVNGGPTRQVAVIPDLDLPGEDGPVWSPDGSRIAFTLTTASDREIYVVGAAGGNVTNITNNSAFDDSPVWSRHDPPGGTGVASTAVIGTPQLSASTGCVDAVSPPSENALPDVIQLCFLQPMSTSVENLELRLIRPDGRNTGLAFSWSEDAMSLEIRIPQLPNMPQGEYRFEWSAAPASGGTVLSGSARYHLP